MGVDLLDQALTFLGAAGLGTALGLVYDLFRILRRRVRLPLLGSALDLLFWALVTAGLFLYAIAAGGGQLRIYMVLALFLGAVVYFLALSRPALFLAGLVADGIAFLWKLCTFPLVLLEHVSKKIEKVAKKHFHYGRRWYNIRLIPEEMEDLTRRAAGGGEGARRDQNKKGRTAHKGGGSGSAHLHGDGPAEPPGPDPGGAGPAGHAEPAGGGADPDQRRTGRGRGKSGRPRPHRRHRPG